MSTLVLLALAGSVAAYKLVGLDYQLADILPQTEYRVGYQIHIDEHDDVSVTGFLPVSDAHQEVTDERDTSPALHFETSTQGLNRVATWSGESPAGGASVRHEFSVIGRALKYEIDSTVPVASTYPETVAAYLRPEKEIQVDDPGIASALQRIGAGQGSALQRLRRIFDFTASLTPRAFKGTTDALTALRLGEASCNGKSRLFVALARRAGIPARLVGGLILENGSKRTSHQWLEVYVSGHWVPFCPTNGHFASIPARYLSLYRGDESLFKHTANVKFDYAFDVSARQVPSRRAKTAFQLANVWALFDRLKLPFSLLGTVLMLPVGALVVVLFRNVIGLPTFGTFLPALIAGAAGETGAGWGILGVLIVVSVVAAVRLALERLELLHSPTLAILLTAVTVTMLALSLGAERAGLTELARVSLFPIAVLAITAERFYLVLTERGYGKAGMELGGTLIVIGACYVVMSSLALQVLVIGFPEVLLLVVAANLYLGRWTGIRVFEYVRFRRLLLSREAAA